MTAQAPVVQGAVSEALSEQDIAFGADLRRRGSLSEAAIPLPRPRYWMLFRRRSASKRINASACPAGGSSIPRTPAGLLPYTSFSRHELNAIFSLYGTKVAAGEWRDYSIDFLKDKAVFSVFRRSTERPLYRIEKNPRLTKRQGAYSVVAMTGLILKRGHDLARVLRVLDRNLSVVNA